MVFGKFLGKRLNLWNYKNKYDILVGSVRTSRYALVARVPAIAIGLAIWLLSSQSTLPTIKGIFGFDKFQHLLAYAAFAAAVWLWFAPKTWRQRGLAVFLAALALGSLYGLIDEVHQYFVPGRACDFWDWVADTLGALLGSGAAWLVSRQILARSGRSII